MFAQFVKEPENTGNQKIDTDIDLHKVFTSASNFIKSPAEVNGYRNVDLGRHGHQGGNQSFTSYVTGMIK